MELAYGKLPLDRLRELASFHSKGRKRLAQRKFPSWLGKKEEKAEDMKGAISARELP